MSRLSPRGTKYLPAKPIHVFGRYISLRLEREMWDWLQEIAGLHNQTRKYLIEQVWLAKRPDRPLSSELRVFVASYWRGRIQKARKKGIMI